MTLMRASRQWAKRPDDERYVSLQDLYQATDSRRQDSYESSGDTEYLQVIAKDDDLFLLAEHTEMKPTHWSFGQLASYAGAPGNYLRQLPADLAAQNLQYGLKHMRLRDESAILWKHPQNQGAELRAITSPPHPRCARSAVT